MEPFKISAVIRGLDGKEDTVKVLEEHGANDVIVEYKDEKCHAIFNIFNGKYYVDDFWKIEQSPPKVKPPTNEERINNFLDRNQSDPMYAIYQLREDGGLRGYAFTDYDTLKSVGKRVERKNYALIYAAPHNGESLDDIYTRFNINHPSDFTGHSLSVSDIVVLKDTAERYAAYYVDSFGFKPLRGFMTDSGRASGKPSRGSEM
jgi:hypothetical protein